MPFSRLVSQIVLASAAPLLCAQIALPVDHQAPPANCHVTLPAEERFVPPAPTGAIDRLKLSADQFWFGSEKLWTVLPADGTWRGTVPSKTGDFAYGDKLPWFLLHPAFSEKDERLTVTGKMLDGTAPSFTETEGRFFANSQDDDAAMIVGGINIPVFGCWQIAGHYGDQDLTFTIWVAPLAAQNQSSDATSPVPAAAAQAVASKRIRIDGEIQAKSLVYKVNPEIPPATGATAASVTVLLHAIIGADGRAREIECASGPTHLCQAAMDAVKWWQYRVAIVNDEAVEVDTTIDVVFRLPG